MRNFDNIISDLMQSSSYSYLKMFVLAISAILFQFLLCATALNLSRNKVKRTPQKNKCNSYFYGVDSIYKRNAIAFPHERNVKGRLFLAHFSFFIDDNLWNRQAVFLWITIAVKCTQNERFESVLNLNILRYFCSPRTNSLAIQRDFLKLFLE